jgi:uncharacterized Ntn-hydrolase superfamily protein
MPRRVMADAEPASNLPVGEARAEQHGNFQLPARQTESHLEPGALSKRHCFYQTDSVWQFSAPPIREITNFREGREWAENAYFVRRQFPYCSIAPTWPKPMTYSVLAHDPATNQLGVLLQSYYYGCGPRTLHAVPGTGIVVMQMVPEIEYGTSGAAQMAAGRHPEEILDDLVKQDAAGAVRQVAMMNAQGDVAAYTGAGCIPVSGHQTHHGLSVQGAMVESEKVWSSAAEVFQSTKGALPERMITAMRAAENEGGDIRGRRAAAMIVVSCTDEKSWVLARPINIRVDDHADPLAEVEKQLAMQRHMAAIELAFERGLSGDAEGAVADYAAIAAHSPDDPDVTMRYGMMLAQCGRMREAREQLLKMTRIHPGWAKVPARLVESGLLPDNRELLDGLVPG